MAALKEYDISTGFVATVYFDSLDAIKVALASPQGRPQREILPTLQTVARSFRRLNAVQQTHGPWEDYGCGSVDYGAEDRGRGKSGVETPP
jgi:hypothetical protein